MPLNLLELTSFLVEANKAGYASGQENVWKKGPDNSTTITYENGDWLFHDNYFGGEPYGGREVVFYKGKPFFIMVYYGRITDKNLDNKVIYTFLQKALKVFPEDKPFRGPKELKEGGLRYENNWQGEIDFFSGEEKIFYQDKEVYSAKYAGGLVDR